MVALVSLTAAAVGLLTYRNIEVAVVPGELDRIRTAVRQLAVELEVYVRSARNDVLGFRAAAALDGIMQARLAGGVHPRDGTTEATWRARMAARYASELAIKPAYYQFRIIGVADGGREILRVDRSGPGNSIRIVPDDGLQRKGDRDYFIRAIRLADGEVDVSPVELNQESGAIETPHVPVLRAGTPVYTQNGQPFAIVIINVDMRSAFAAIRSSVRGGGKV
ncbi:MAG: hybrid sensor histidine kinase/response regulator, partial [Proteobacteria bacterium]|nr:hybrid sensor histidine kinase/response regulator [Pseudomonadota bacterium]